MMRVRRIAFAATLLCSTFSALAQVREQITVEEVDVPVYVFQQGKPVRNLTKDDFELYVNGKPQAIDYFELVDFAEPPLPAAPKPETAPVPQSPSYHRRRFLFIFDYVYSTQAGLDRSRRAAIEMVDHALPDDLFAVAVVTPAQRLVLMSPFLRDRDAVHRAIRQDRLPESHAPEVPRARDEMQLFRDLAMHLRELDGEKHVILFSRGFYVDRALPGSPLRSPSNVDNPLSEQFRHVSEMAAAFQSANAFLHTVDLTTAATGAASLRSSSAGQPSIPDSANEALLWISAVTGGQWIHWTNELAPALDELSASYSAAYRLGFKPANARKDHNDIEVKVRSLPPGAKVSFRRGFAQ